MPVVLQAVARLVALKRLGVLLFVLAATLCATNTASAHERLQTKTRVRNFELAEHHSYGLSNPVKQRKPSGKSRYWCPNSHQIHSYRWRDPSGRDAEEWFLRNADSLQGGALAVSAAAITIATAGLAGEALGLGTLESQLGAAGSALTAAARSVTTGAATSVAAIAAAATSATKCESTPEIGSTVLGHYPEYVELAERTGANYFQIPSADWAAMSSTEQWAANQAFLDAAIANGEQFVLATPLASMNAGTFFEMEVEYLMSQGYVANASGTLLSKGPL